MINKKNVLVAMSGGVDSSTVLGILLNQGYSPIGITLKLHNLPNKNVEDAKNICDKFSVKHIVVDYSDKFKNIVIDKFVNDYKCGISTIPCISCNKNVKFGFLLNLLNELNCEYLATGHYARILKNKNEFELHSAIDESKDQTHFLYHLDQDKLSKILFPLGNLESKEETRKIARDLGLSVSEKKESQDVCFIPGKFGNYLSSVEKSFLKEGDIIDFETKKTIGKHNGAVFYTKGQRKGIGIGGNNDPIYVIDVDIENNLVYVGKENLLFQNEFYISNCNIINFEYRNLDEFECEIRTRALKPKCNAIVKKISDERFFINLKTKDRAITKGQVCVMYDETKVIGGGVIDFIYQQEE